MVRSRYSLVSVFVVVWALYIALTAGARAGEGDATAVGAEADFQEFQRWCSRHGRLYRSFSEYDDRLQTFSINKRRIDLFNEQQREVVARRRSSSSARRPAAPQLVLALNKYADLTNEEFRRLLLNPGIGSASQTDFGPNVTDSRGAAARAEPAPIDWRTRGAVTEVRDQGQCGSCWTFSVVSGCEGANVVAGRPLTSFSEQQLLDCSYNKPSTRGCKGGDTRVAMSYAVRQGLARREAYPYTGTDSSECRNDRQSVARFRGFLPVPTGDEGALARTVARYGPTSVAIDAGSFQFQFYSSGVLEDHICSASRLNHAVTVVGFTDDAWILKNSWGRDYGQGGYVYLARNKSNMCGIATYAFAPLAA